MAPSTLRALGAALCTGVASSAIAVSDDTPLVQLSTHARGNQPEDHCPCVPWNSVYRSLGVLCGQGNELAFFGGMRARETHEQEYCKHAYARLSNNYCTQLHYQQQRTEQWCYVAADCNTNSTTLVQGTLAAWKTCSPQQDRMLGKMSVPELVRIAQDDNVDPAVLFKMAYPVYEYGLNWQDVKDYLLGGEASRAVKANYTIIEDIQASGEPMIFDSPDHTTPFGMLYGSQAFENEETKWLHHAWFDDNVDWKANSNKLSQWTCVLNC